MQSSYKVEKIKRKKRDLSETQEEYARRKKFNKPMRRRESLHEEM